jgi:hypothetical protein
VSVERDGFLFECATCGHQTRLTSGTLLEKTRKPLKVWFPAVFEISTRRTGVSAKDLQRIMEFGSYETAWTWLHKLRVALVRPDREPLGPLVQINEALVGGKGSPHKELVLVPPRPAEGCASRTSRTMMRAHASDTHPTWQGCPCVIFNSPLTFLIINKPAITTGSTSRMPSARWIDRAPP